MAQDELNNSIEIVRFSILEKFLKKHYYAEKVANEEEYNYKVKGKALAHLPSVGVTLGLPTVSWNSKSIYDIGNVKRLNKAKIKSINLKYEGLYKSELQKLKIEYEKFNVSLSILKIKEELFKIDADMFAIYEEAYAKQELTPLDFLKHKKAFHSKKADIELYRKELIIKKLEIYVLAKYMTEEEIQDSNDYWAEYERSEKEYQEKIKTIKIDSVGCIMLSPEFEKMKNGQ